MDSNFESKIITAFFSSRSSERLIYEAAKKRSRIFDKLAHTCEEYLKSNAIYEKSKLPHNESEIIKFLSDKTCYVISQSSETDGKYMNTEKALKALYKNGAPYMLISSNCKKAYLETEYNFSEHYSYLLNS